MSGGVDSSVVAALAARTGAQVIGVTLQLYDHGEAVKRSGSCCAGQDIYDAKTVCDRLGIAHYVLDYESRFRTGVIDKFADEYAQGRTPVPCSLCNQGVKFTDLIGFAPGGLYAAYGQGGGSFGTSFLAHTGFGSSAGSGGWTNMDQYPRILTDLNGDGGADILGFGESGVITSVSVSDWVLA